MTLTTRQLIEIAPIDENIKKQALAKLPGMSGGQIFELEQICWDALANQADVKRRALFEDQIDEIAKGTKTDTVNLGRIDDEVTTNLLKKMEQVTTKDQLSAVKMALAGQKKAEEQASSAIQQNR